ncbi:hypothetical protein TorRG33x02_240090 [Trema orientale]|uniref:Uncharacterized protein n=1 Tax=Trema orientale TaxID=63057 RepID=A0A2P5DWJ5_TREOI|nr:hypothetical protein TorRG33x02_240090 [Trema orientale]
MGGRSYLYLVQFTLTPLSIQMLSSFIPRDGKPDYLRRFLVRGFGYYLSIYSSNGGLLLYRITHRVLLYYDQGWTDVKHVRSRDFYGFQVICHTPTLISLRDIVTRENM